MFAGLRWAFGPGTLGRSLLVTCGLAAFGFGLAWLTTPPATEAGPLGRDGHRCPGGRCAAYAGPTLPQRPLASFGYGVVAETGEEESNADEGAERPPWVASLTPEDTPEQDAR